MRARHRWLDHLIRAGVRYQRADGRRLAAAVTFNAFFAVFALGLLGFAVLGYVVDEPVVDQAVQRFLDEYLPRMDTEGLRAARGAAGLIALVSLPLIGLLWVDTLRSSIRAVWQIEEYPGRFLVRWAMNLVALVGLGLLLAVSLTLAFGAEALLQRLLDGVGGVGGVGGDETLRARWLLAATRYTLGLAVNTLLSIAVLTMLPRIRIPPRQVLPPALLIAGGLELLTSLGRLAVAGAQANPAFQLVAGATGLLVFLLILNQLILFGAALTATNTRGRVRDLATGQRLPADQAPPAAQPPPRVDIQPSHSEGSDAPNGDPV